MVVNKRKYYRGGGVVKNTPGCFWGNTALSKEYSAEHIDRKKRGGYYTNREKNDP